MPHFNINNTACSETGFFAMFILTNTACSEAGFFAILILTIQLEAGFYLPF